MKIISHTLALAAFTLVSCQNPAPVAPKLDYSPASSVTADEVIWIAQSYVTHSYKPTARNRRHGLDRDGVQVDTPDRKYLASIGRPYGWDEGVLNIGMPYKWGGYDTPESFDKKLAQGLGAGDSYTLQKRKLLYKGVSEDTAGIDCSGLISRAWRLDRAYSTRELPQLCDTVQDLGNLQMGDILNKHNEHVILFVHWANEEKTLFYAFEAGSPPKRKAIATTYSLAFLKGLGYKAYRYKNIKEARSKIKFQRLHQHSLSIR